METLKKIVESIYAALKEDEGQAGIELMLTIPFFLGFVLLAVDVSVLTYQAVAANNAVREGARFGAVNCQGVPCARDLVCDRTVERSSGTISDGDPDDVVTVGWVDRTGNGQTYNKGDSVTVDVSHRYQFLFFPFIEIDVLAGADMRLEQTDDTTTLTGPAPCW